MKCCCLFSSHALRIYLNWWWEKGSSNWIRTWSSVKILDDPVIVVIPDIAVIIAIVIPAFGRRTGKPVFGRTGNFDRIGRWETLRKNSSQEKQTTARHLEISRNSEIYLQLFKSNQCLFIFWTSTNHRHEINKHCIHLWPKLELIISIKFLRDKLNTFIK